MSTLQEPISSSDGASYPRHVDLEDPIETAVRLRPPETRWAREHFAATDPHPGWELTRYRWVHRLVSSRRFQFALILPNQIIFWLVIFVGLAGTVVPGLNFGTAITWYLWFCLVFVMMVVVGRAWCSMCPFGGFAEWLQRKALWRRTQKTLGLGRKLPEPIARYGFLLSVGAFLLLTWFEEYFNIAGPGAPSDTSWMVVGIVASAVTVFLVFERRTFCRYLCPLSALIGSIGSVGSAAGFRTKDRDVCLECKTKECMRGGTSGYGCPWYTWPASADSNLACGLCSECFKACPSDNVGLFVQPPMRSIIAPRRRRPDVALAVLLLWGLVLFQQVNATSAYASLDGWLNRLVHFPQYPNPVDYLGITLLGALLTGGVIWVMSRVFGRSEQKQLSAAPKTSLLAGHPRFLSFLLPLSYGLIPVVGADFFARQLPKMFLHVARLIPAVGAIFGLGSTHSSLYNVAILSVPQIVIAQVVVIALGTVGASWATWRIASKELGPVSNNLAALRVASMSLVVACGAAAGFLYVIMHAAQ